MSLPSVLARLSLVGAVVGIAPAALAARVAVLVPIIEARPPFSDGKRNKFHDTLTKGLQDEAGVATTVVPSAEVRQTLAGNGELLSCQSGPCLSQVAAKLSADRLVVVHINVKGAMGGAAYTIDLAVFDQAGSPLAMNGAERCGDDSDGCNLPRAYETLRRASASIAGLIISEKIPPRPVDKPVPELQLKDPSTPEPPATLPPPTPPPVTTSPPSSTSSQPYFAGYRYGWITAAVVGGAFVVSSIPFLYFASLEGQTNCGVNVPRNQCPQVYQGNLGPGLGLLLGGGLASAGAFAMLFYLDKREQRRTKTALLPVPVAGGMAFQLAGRF